MGFLDNSGDIILDAVLTDTGRMRLAKGDGSFRITKFALGDDEIDYSLYDGNNASGSAYYDLEILQTPVFEAFTNNMSNLKSKLVSFNRNNLLYLPVIKVNNLKRLSFANSLLVDNGFMIAVDNATEVALLNNAAYLSSGVLKDANSKINGLLYGSEPTKGDPIRLDQGLDNPAMPASIEIDSDLLETQYIIEIDNRFASIVNGDGVTGQGTIAPSYIDDDNIASYYVSQGSNRDFVTLHEAFVPNTVETQEVIVGTRGTILEFKLKSSNEVSTSDYLFKQFGEVMTGWTGAGVSGKTVYSILTSITVSGATTGYSVEIPLRLIKVV